VTDPPPQDEVTAERWFLSHGLPYFVDDVRAGVHRGLARGRLVLVVLIALAMGAAAGSVVGLLAGRLDLGLTVGAQTAIAVLLLYALTTLRAWAIATWAFRRTLRSLGQLFPLVTRALPLLLLFITFLFINAEVWEVAADLDGSVMWLTVALFTAITVGFLLARLPEELDGLDPAAAEHRIGGLQRANLVLVLLIVQLVQVLLLALAVFAFFVGFGLLVMEPDTIRGWTGQESLHALSFFERANIELLQVSTFLAAFSGLYFTVYAVTDEVYRKQFFTGIEHELERAVTAHRAYRAFRRENPVT
jgi:hypothetical protein